MLHESSAGDPGEKGETMTAVFRTVRVAQPIGGPATYVEATDGTERYARCGCLVGACACSGAPSSSTTTTAPPKASQPTTTAQVPRQLELPAPAPSLTDAIRDRRAGRRSNKRRTVAASETRGREATRRATVMKFLRSRLSPPTEATKPEPHTRAASEESPDPPPDLRQAIARARGAA